MSPHRIKVVENWKLVPSKDDTVALVGMINGAEIQTTPIRSGGLDEVRTENADYILGNKLPGMWESQLEAQRPQKVASLRQRGVL